MAVHRQDKLTITLKLSYLTHTSIQFFKKEVWENSVKCVPKNVNKHIVLILPVY